MAEVDRLRAAAGAASATSIRRSDAAREAAIAAALAEFDRLRAGAAPVRRRSGHAPAHEPRPWLGVAAAVAAIGAARCGDRRALGGGRRRSPVTRRRDRVEPTSSGRRERRDRVGRQRRTGDRPATPPSRHRRCSPPRRRRRRGSAPPPRSATRRRRIGRPPSAGSAAASAAADATRAARCAVRAASPIADDVALGRLAGRQLLADEASRHARHRRRTPTVRRRDPSLDVLGTGAVHRRRRRRRRCWSPSTGDTDGHVRASTPTRARVLVTGR